MKVYMVRMICYGAPILYGYWFEEAHAQKWADKWLELAKIEFEKSFDQISDEPMEENNFPFSVGILSFEPQAIL